MTRLLLPLSLTAILWATPASASIQVPDSVVTARRETLRQFRTEFLGRDRSYSREHRAAAEARLAVLDTALVRVSPVYFELELSRIVALADNGHTIAFPAGRARRYNRVPFRLVPFGESFYVLRADSALESLLGGELVAIDGQPVAEAIAAARTLTGGTPARRDRNASYFLESPEQMAALGVARQSGTASYRFRMPDGRTVERQITAAPPDPRRDRSGADRWLFPEAHESQGPEWRTLITADQAPWAFRDVNTAFRWRASPELEAIVIEFRANRDADRPIREFLDEMQRVISTGHPRNLILDMRLNGGGDLNTTRDFMKRLPTLVRGRIFVLTSPWTFSAAISSVGYLKQADPKRVAIVGEPVGDRLEFWSEGSVVLLNRLDIAVLYATERHDYRTGCRPYRDCHASVVRNPISVPSLAPDIAAPLTLEAYRAGRDPGMEAIAAALAAGGN